MQFCLTRQTEPLFELKVAKNLAGRKPGYAALVRTVATHPQYTEDRCCCPAHQLAQDRVVRTVLVVAEGPEEHRSSVDLEHQRMAAGIAAAGSNAVHIDPDLDLDLVAADRRAAHSHLTAVRKTQVGQRKKVVVLVADRMQEVWLLKEVDLVAPHTVNHSRGTMGTMMRRSEENMMTRGINVHTIQESGGQHQREKSYNDGVTYLLLLAWIAAAARRLCSAGIRCLGACLAGVRRPSAGLLLLARVVGLLSRSHRSCICTCVCICRC